MSFTTPSNPSSLVTHLEKSFSNLPNPHTVHFTVLTSTPKRTTSLYPYTTHHPRCFQVDYLITLACEVDRTSGQGAGGEGKRSANANGNGDSQRQEESSSAPKLGSSDTGDSSADQIGELTPTPNPVPIPTVKSEPASRSRVMTTALSAHLYILPHHQTTILYISKLDSSGYPTTPTPLTRTFITSILTYFVLPQTRPSPFVRIQLFARSQGQYLFPNSSQGPKKVLGGLGLCGWWKGVYEDVAAASAGDVRLGMVLPGYSADEAKGMLGQRKPLGEGLKWTSDPPFTTPLPTHSSSSSSLGPSSSLGELETPPGAPTRSSLAALIPSLPDDPKARFLDDLVSEGAEDPQRRRQFLKPKPEGGSSSASIQSTSTSSATVTATSPGKKRDPLRSKVKAEDEAERRFTSSTLKRISLGEYWERMGFRQECISGDVTGFFTLESGPPNLIPSGSSSNSAPMQPNTSNTSDPKPTSEALPPGIVDRILQALLNTDFKSFESAIDQSALWDRSVKSIVVDETGEEGYRKCIGVVEGKEGEVVVPVKRKEEAVVTMLQPRKKKKV